MVKRATFSVLVIAAALFCMEKPAAAQSSYSTWLDAYYDFEVYYGVPQKVWYIVSVYDDGSTEYSTRYISANSRDYTMWFWAEHGHPDGAVRWYFVTREEVVYWTYYQTYATRARAQSTADWIESMGLTTEIRNVYNPILSPTSSSLNLKLR